MKFLSVLSVLSLMGLSMSAHADSGTLGECPLYIEASLFGIGTKPLQRLRNNQEYQAKVKTLSQLQELDVGLELMNQSDRRCTYQGPAFANGRRVPELGQVTASIYIKQYGGDEPEEGKMLNLQFASEDARFMMFIAVRKMSAHSLEVIGYSADDTKDIYTELTRSPGSNETKLERAGFTSYQFKAL